MTQDEIIRIAKEAGFTESKQFEGIWIVNQDEVNSFAAIVREQAYREDKSLTLGFEVTEREWVDLTDDEIYPLYNEPISDREAIEFARAVIAADRKLNGVEK